MKQASHLDLQIPMLRTGIKFRTSPADFSPSTNFS